MHLAGRIARELLRRLPAQFELDDLEAAGRLGLLHAAERYRPCENGDVPFSLFARAWIRGAILSAVRREWCNGEGRHALKPMTEPLPAAEDWSTAAGDTGAIEEAIDDARRVRMVQAAVETLPAGQQRVLRAVYSAGAQTVRAAAVELGIPASRAYRLHNSGISALRERLVR